MKLYLRQRVLVIGDKYRFTDSDGNLVFKGKKPALSITRMYLNDAYGEEQCFIKRRLVSLMPKYKVFKGKEQVLYIRKKLKFGRPKFIVEDANKKSFEIKGSWMAWDFTVFFKGEYIGAIHKKFLRIGDTYELDISDSYDPALFCSLALILDNSMHGNKNKRFGIND